MSSSSLGPTPAHTPGVVVREILHHVIGLGRPSRCPAGGPRPRRAARLRPGPAAARADGLRRRDREAAHGGRPGCAPDHREVLQDESRAWSGRRRPGDQGRDDRAGHQHDADARHLQHRRPSSGSSRRLEPQQGGQGTGHRQPAQVETDQQRPGMGRSPSAEQHRRRKVVQYDRGSGAQRRGFQPLADRINSAGPDHTPASVPSPTAIPNRPTSTGRSNAVAASLTGSRWYRTSRPIAPFRRRAPPEPETASRPPMLRRRPWRWRPHGPTAWARRGRPLCNGR